ncbi:uncharacterized protein N7459_002600 [Penicillium hispanicum]|uniref:uncharacterized protein n=1 Tax=Penicillium hispanicum TaxID=1080232 RepID=UPI0025418F8F|nr:uncharacterized protein N7459_002600 [Penicillium hispanicum]KAJ5586835.1 hypothetical protein N7459_002600 [Penicillium hispanicum]
MVLARLFAVTVGSRWGGGAGCPHHLRQFANRIAQWEWPSWAMQGIRPGGAEHPLIRDLDQMESSHPSTGGGMRSESMVFASSKSGGATLVEQDWATRVSMGGENQVRKKDSRGDQALPAKRANDRPPLSLTSPPLRRVLKSQLAHCKSPIAIIRGTVTLTLAVESTSNPAESMEDGVEYEKERLLRCRSSTPFLERGLMGGAGLAPRFPRQLQPQIVGRGLWRPAPDADNSRTS